MIERNRGLAIPPIRHEDVLSAIADYDRGDLEPRFRQTTAYQLKHEGKAYPPKAVVARAAKYLMGEALSPDDFSSGVGAGQAVAVLRDLGFEVVEAGKRRNPPWTADEIILALDFYLANRHSMPGKDSPDVKGLSADLRRLGSALWGDQDGSTFRNVNGTYMKLMNLRRLDPDYEGAGLAAGGKLEEELWDRYFEDPVLLGETAEAIRAGLDSDVISDHLEDDDNEEAEAPEGKVLTRTHRVRERDPKLAKRKKAAFLRAHGRLHCEACGFDFEASYGSRGSGYIECHHIKPVSDLRPGDKTKLSDLALLCSNCHRMVHCKRPWLTLDELRVVISRSAK